MSHRVNSGQPMLSRWAARQVKSCPRCGREGLPAGLVAHDICPGREYPDPIRELFEAYEEIGNRPEGEANDPALSHAEARNRLAICAGDIERLREAVSAALDWIMAHPERVGED